jgi:PAS domain S-box-containing protein
MNYQDKTKGELIRELQKLQQEYDSLKTSYEKDIIEHKQAEQNQVSLIAMLDAMPSFVGFADAKDTHILYINPSGRKMVGIQAQEDLTHLKIADVHPAWTNKLLRNEILPTAIRDGIWTGECAFLNRDGHEISVMMVLLAHKLPSGEVERFSTVSMDITERKQAEELLKESAERLNEAQKLAHIGVWDWKPDTDTVTWTDELYNIAGLDPKLPAPTYKEHCNLYTPKSWELLKTSVEKAMETGESYQLELELICPNGDIRFVNAFGGAKIDSKGQVNGLFGTVQDITEHKRVEKELRLQSEIMKNITEGVNLIRSEDEIIVFTNPKLDEMFGYEHGELNGKHVYILNAPAGKSPVEIKQDIVDSVSMTGEWHGEILNIKKNGNHFWCYVNVAVFDHPEYGKVYLSVHSDITERKMAEAALKESEAKFRSLFENSLLGISIARPGGDLLQVNLAYARMYGYENPEVLLAEVHDTGVLFANPEERKEVLRDLQINGFMEAREFELIRRDGSHFFVLVSASEIRDSEGKLLFNMAAHIDLTQRRKYEEKMRAAWLYARNLLEASIDPLITINVEGKITEVNSMTEQITGIKRDKLIGSNFVNYVTEPDRANRGLKIIFSKGTVRNFPLKILHSDGREIEVLFNASLFKNETGEIQGVFAVARDITEIKKMEGKLRKSKALLEDLNQHLNEIRENERALISREIHDELGQSMTALKLDLSQMYKSVGADPAAMIQLDSMIALVSDTIKNVQRISSDLRPSILDDLGLVPAIEWYCDEFEKRTSIKCNLELDNSDYNDSLINLTFFRVLQETLTNVIRHARASSVKVRLHQFKNGTFLTIQDNGIGITKEEIESQKSLGLINIHERVRQLHGKIVISSKKGDGTKLTIFIPINK